jgi:Ca-activated chloride channel family protein
MSRPRRLIPALLALLVPALVLGAAPAAAVPRPATPSETTPVMVVLDASGSMNQADAPGPRIDAAKRAVGELVAALPDDARVGLTAYGTGTGSSAAEKARGCKDIKQLVPVERVDRAAFGRAVAGLRASGYTPIGESLRVAARGLPAEGPRSIVLVSDGEDTCAPPPPCDVAKQLKKAGIDLVMHTIGFKVGAAARAQLACIASATGGSYREAASGAALGAELTSRVQRAIRPYEAVGIPVRGGSSPANAPVIRPGQYLDTYEQAGPALGSDGTTKFYAVDLGPEDTPYLSATIAPLAVPVAAYETLGVTVSLVDARDQTCVLPLQYAGDVGVYGKVTPQTAVLRPGPKSSRAWTSLCADSTRYYLKVARRNDAFAGRPLAVEVAFRIEPPVTSPGPAAIPAAAAPLPAPRPGPARPVESGSSFNDAPVIGPGTYTDSITMGETRYYRVPLRWGQRMAVGATFSVPGQGLAGSMRLAFASPLRADLRPGGPDTSSVLAPGLQNAVRGSTDAPVRFANRQSDDSTVQSYTVDGDYFVILNPTYSLRPGETPMLGVTLTVEVVGTPEQGPEYALTAASPSASPGGTEGATGSPAPDAAESVAGSAPTRRVDGGRWLWAGAGAGVVLLAALGGLLWWHRRAG